MYIVYYIIFLLMNIYWYSWTTLCTTQGSYCELYSNVLRWNDIIIPFKKCGIGTIKSMKLNTYDIINMIVLILNAKLEINSKKPQVNNWHYIALPTGTRNKAKK